MWLQVVCVKGGAQLFEDAEIGLCYYEADIDDYVPMACSLHADAFGGLLLTVVSCTSTLHRVVVIDITMFDIRWCACRQLLESAIGLDIAGLQRSTTIDISSKCCLKHPA